MGHLVPIPSRPLSTCSGHHIEMKHPLRLHPREDNSKIWGRSWNPQGWVAQGWGTSIWNQDTKACYAGQGLLSLAPCSSGARKTREQGQLRQNTFSRPIVALLAGHRWEVHEEGWPSAPRRELEGQAQRRHDHGPSRFLPPATCWVGQA